MYYCGRIFHMYVYNHIFERDSVLYLPILCETNKWLEKTAMFFEVLAGILKWNFLIL